MAEGSQVVVIDAAGHFMNVEQPDVVNATLWSSSLRSDRSGAA